jgi:hypothetical protein
MLQAQGNRRKCRRTGNSSESSANTDAARATVTPSRRLLILSSSISFVPACCICCYICDHQNSIGFRKCVIAYTLRPCCVKRSINGFLQALQRVWPFLFRARFIVFAETFKPACFPNFDHDSFRPSQSFRSIPISRRTSCLLSFGGRPGR